MAVDNIEREVLVLAIFRQLLQTPALGPQQNFFEAGGSSLLAARLAARLRSAGVLDVPTSAIFAAPTARALTRYASALRPVTESVAGSGLNSPSSLNSSPTSARASASSIAPGRASSGTTPAAPNAVDRGARQRAAFTRLRVVPSVPLPGKEDQR